MEPDKKVHVSEKVVLTALIEQLFEASCYSMRGKFNEFLNGVNSLLPNYFCENEEQNRDIKNKTYESWHSAIKENIYMWCKWHL